jgi:hypothetical protein
MEAARGLLVKCWEELLASLHPPRRILQEGFAIAGRATNKFLGS